MQEEPFYNVGGSVVDCNFDGCYARDGGAIYSASGTLRNNKIFNCRALLGGGISNLGTAINNVVGNCFADYTLVGEDKGGAGGGVYNKGTFVGGIVYNCTSFHGGGIFVDGGKVINCTIQNNKSRKAATSANIDYSSNSEEQKDVINTISSTTVDKSNFKAPTTFEGSTIDEKEMKDILLASWELQAGSEFIDKGVTINVENYTKDIYGNDRIVGNSIDIGASEFKPATAIASVLPNGAALRYSYYSISGQYIGSVCPSLAGLYIVKTTEGNKVVSTKKVLVK